VNGARTRVPRWEELLAECHVKFNVTMEIKSTETIKQAVVAGMESAFSRPTR